MRLNNMSKKTSEVQLQYGPFLRGSGTPRVVCFSKNGMSV